MRTMESPDYFRGKHPNDSGVSWGMGGLVHGILYSTEIANWWVVDCNDTTFRWQLLRIVIHWSAR